jgi:endonuclease YncB( thermonuclease family)
MDSVAQETATVAQRHEARRHGHPRYWFTFAAAVLALPAAAQTIVDGDTIKVKGTTYRLYGIDAAEKDQHCTDGWAAGRAAISYLSSLVQDQELACEVVAKSRNGATPALCTVGGQDLGAAMVATGMAWASTRHSNDYIDEEAQANIDRLGVHGHDCVPAWDWRPRQQRR